MLLKCFPTTDMVPKYSHTKVSKSVPHVCTSWSPKFYMDLGQSTVNRNWKQG